MSSTEDLVRRALNAVAEAVEVEQPARLAETRRSTRIGEPSPRRAVWTFLAAAAAMTAVVGVSTAVVRSQTDGRADVAASSSGAPREAENDGRPDRGTAEDPSDPRWVWTPFGMPGPLRIVDSFAGDIPNVWVVRVEDTASGEHFR